MDKKVIAYCLTKNLNRMTEEDIKRLDVIHIAFGLIKNGEVYWNRINTTSELERIRGINARVKIVLSIGGWGADGFSDAALTKEKRDKFAASSIKLIQEEKLDGLDIDWEYPCSDAAEIKARCEDKENFTLLIEEVRRQLDAISKEKTLSIAAGALASYINGTNMKDVEKYLDYVQLMTYDFHGAFSEVTGHVANLYKSDAEPEAPCADEAVALFVNAGVPIEKIIMGAVFYGLEWSGVPNENKGLAQLALKKGTRVKKYEEIEEILLNKASGFERIWDEKAKAAYLFNGEEFISYEDKEALLEKVNYVKQHNMGGIMYWEYSQDGTNTLTGYLYENMQQEKTRME